MTVGPHEAVSHCASLPRVTTGSQRIVFDLTTSARWQGPPVGIVRTERELARFAREAVDVPVEYSVFDLQSGAFLRLRPDVVSAILDERVTIDFTGEDGEPQAPAPSLAERALWVARNPRHFVRNRLNRSAGTGWARSTATLEATGPLTIPLKTAVDGVVEFSAGDAAVSCGLDWAHKDYQAIINEKRRSRFSYVGVCYDTIPWKFPQFWPPGLAPAVVTALAETAWMADAVMCISKSTANDYSEFCTKLQMPCPRLGIFRLGDTDLDKVARGAIRGSLPVRLQERPFVLYVSSIEPRKNHRLLYNVWDDLAGDHAFPDDVVLALVGASRWMSEDLVREIGLNPLVRDRIVVIDDADDPALHSLYSECLFTVFPSFYEGWGLPVAESLDHGKICLASDRGSIPEISPLTVMLSPYDHAAWRDAIRRYVTDDAERLRLERRIREGFRATTWSDCAESFYREVLACLAG